MSKGVSYHIQNRSLFVHTVTWTPRHHQGIGIHRVLHLVGRDCGPAAQYAPASKETYCYAKRDLLLCQRRPNDTRITRYGVSVKRALLQWQKRPNDAGMYAEWREASLRPKVASFTSIWALFWHLCMHNWGMFMWKGLIWHINRTLCP